ncbi:hypothetical protein MA9V1_154 [Chryseobacterium phage MA9V-1]|nr:hypothetical protein MA9V1_154 [Chryseobacterium phage MA9V-1]
MKKTYLLKGHDNLYYCFEHYSYWHKQKDQAKVFHSMEDVETTIIENNLQDVEIITLYSKQ